MTMRLHLGLVLVVVGCATNPTPNPEPEASTDVVRTAVAPGEMLDLTRQTVFHDGAFAVPRARVWDAVLASEADLAMPIESADSAEGTVVFRVQTPTPRIAGRHAATWLDCGTGPAGAPRVNTYHLSVSLTVVVESLAQNRSRARISVVAFARDRSVIGDRLPCRSTGKLEQRTLAILAGRLAP
jgi:hypothetical protein